MTPTSTATSTAGPETFVDAAGVSLCTQAFGDPDHPALLLVGGAAWSMDWWPDAWCERLAAAGHHVVRYDHRDTGRSGGDPPGRPTYDGERLADDALAVLDGLGLTRAHLLGLSMGGGIVQALALEHPDRVASLTVLASSPVGGVADDLPGPTAGLVATFQDPAPEPDWADRDAVVAWWLAGEVPLGGALGVDEALVREAAGRGWDRARDPAAALNHVTVIGAGAGDDGPQPDVRQILAPTLVVHGSDDPLFPPAHGRALAGAVPGARLLVVEGMGHQLPPLSTWDDVLTAVLAHTARPAAGVADTTPSAGSARAGTGQRCP